MPNTPYTPTWLQTQRERLHLSQHALGDALGVRSNTISSWERGTFAPRSWPMLALAIEALIARQDGT